MYDPRSVDRKSAAFVTWLKRKEGKKGQKEKKKKSEEKKKRERRQT